VNIVPRRHRSNPPPHPGGHFVVELFQIRLEPNTGEPTAGTTQTIARKQSLSRNRPAEFDPPAGSCRFIAQRPDAPVLFPSSAAKDATTRASGAETLFDQGFHVLRVDMADARKGTFTVCIMGESS